jgi:hypothetical protein
VNQLLVEQDSQIRALLSSTIGTTNKVSKHTMEIQKPDLLISNCSDLRTVIRDLNARLSTIEDCHRQLNSGVVRQNCRIDEMLSKLSSTDPVFKR